MLRKFIADRSGNLTIIAALMMSGLALMTGFAIDFAMWERREQHLQAAVDATALTLAISLESFSSTTADHQISCSIDDARRTLIAEGVEADGLGVRAERVRGERGEGDGCRVEATIPAQSFIVGPMGVTPPELSARATAALARGSAICVIALDDDARGALDIRVASSLRAPNCALQANSSHREAVMLGRGDYDVGEICAVGGARAPSGSDVREGCAEVDDPLRTLDPRFSTACTHRGGLHLVVPPFGARLEPGVYCGGIQMTGIGDVEMAPGVYVMRDGNFQLTIMAQLRGEGVTLVLMGDATLTVSGIASFRISAPESGPFAGIAVFQAADPNGRDRRNLPTSSVRGAATSGIEGVIYLPGQELVLTGADRNATPANYTMVVARRVTFSGNRPVEINFNLNRSSVPWAAPAYMSGGVRLVN